MKNYQLFEPGEYIQPSSDALGYFSILAKKGGRMIQESYPVDALPIIVDTVNPNYDTYITQTVFGKQNRLAVNVLHIGLMFADLDTYHVPALQDKTPERRAELVADYCVEKGIPRPSIVLFSGRGLQAKWLLSPALRPDRLLEWNRVQNYLVKQFEGFGGDQKARDVSRVLRLDQTVNTKSGEVCRVVYVSSGVKSIPTRYDFQDFLNMIPDEKPEPEKKIVTPTQSHINKIRARKGFTFEQLNWYRLYDMRDLISMRGGEVQEGSREVTLFYMLNFLLIADPVRRAQIWRECQGIAAEIAREGGWYYNSDLSTLYRKARAVVYGDGTIYAGKKYPTLYTPRNQTLIDIFRIEPDEMRQLRTIIDTDEKNRRRREKRRTQGMQEQRYRYYKPWEELGISRQWYYELRRRGDLPDGYR